MTLVSVCVLLLNFWTHRDTDTEMDTELDNNNSIYLFLDNLSKGLLIFFPKSALNIVRKSNNMYLVSRKIQKGN